MVAAEALTGLRRSFSVLGTDISGEVIAEARRGDLSAVDSPTRFRPRCRERYLMTARATRRAGSCASCRSSGARYASSDST